MDYMSLMVLSFHKIISFTYILLPFSPYSSVDTFPNHTPLEKFKLEWQFLSQSSTYSVAAAHAVSSFSKEEIKCN